VTDPGLKTQMGFEGPAFGGTSHLFCKAAERRKASADEQVHVEPADNAAIGR